MSTPMAEAIIRPRVQPEESPRQCRPGTFVFSVGVHGDAVAVELQLRRVQQRLIGGKAGHDLVHGLDEVDDIEHGAVRHGGRDVARDGVRQRGADVRLH